MIKYIDQKQLESMSGMRAGEIKLGQSIKAFSSLEDCLKSDQEFIIIGINEDIGIRGNFGKPGAIGAFDLSIEALAKAQDNSFINSKSIGILGSLEFPDLLKAAKNMTKEDCRSLVDEIDQGVSSILQQLFDNHKTPIIIGGGHNNAYPNIKALASAKGSSAVLNIDPHADLREMEGRHSGNGFSYAKHENYLKKYFVWGLHEAYNNQYILDIFRETIGFSYMTYEEILNYPKDFQAKLIKDILQFLSGHPLGLELDLDSIVDFPASAKTPSGFSLDQVRFFIRTICEGSKPSYFHICEASPQGLSEQEKAQMGKSISYLIQDFIKVSSDGVI